MDKAIQKPLVGWGINRFGDMNSETVEHCKKGIMVLSVTYLWQRWVDGINFERFIGKM